MGSGPDSSFLPVHVKRDLVSNAWDKNTFKPVGLPLIPNPLGDASEARAGAAGAVMVFSTAALSGVTACCASKVENPCKPKRSNEWLPKRDDPIYLQ